MVASSDLKGLGATDGPELAYFWTPPSVLPLLLPWLGVLALLVAKPNRSARAWLIWCPLALVAAATSLGTAPLLSNLLPSGVVTLMENSFTSLAFGLATVWLLSPHLEHRLRFVSFLNMLLACAIMTAFACLTRQDSIGIGEALGFLVFLSVCVLLAISAFSLAGLVCRRRYQPLKLAIWTAVLLAGLALALAAPFVVIALFASGGGVVWPELLGGVLALAGACYAVLLPFLLLSYAGDFYRQRLKNLLHLETAASPPVLTPPPLSPTA